MSPENELPPEHEDEVLDLLRQERPEPQPGLAERVLAQVQGAAGAERLFWREAERLARQGLIASAAALLLSGGLVFWVSQPSLDAQASPTVASKAPSERPGPERTQQPATTQQPAAQTLTAVEELALSSPEQSLAAIRPALSQGLWLLPSEEE